MRTEGFAAEKFASVADAFHAAFAGQPTMGAALCVYIDGVPVIDLYGGVADERDGRPWQEDTAGVIFSCTKGLMSILAARLVQDGQLSYDASVASYWPDFAVAGKEEVLVRHILSHRSGLSAPRADLTLSDALDWGRVTSFLAQQEPIWEPGTGYAYHALTHGWLIGEVIRRVTAKSVRDVFREVLAAPLHADAWLGAPAGVLPRIAHLQIGATLAELTRQQAAEEPSEGPDWPALAMTLGRAFPRELVSPQGGFNDPTVQQAEIPGAGAIATARALAKMWSATVVETDGVRLLDDAVLARALAVQSEGPPVFPAPGPWPRWGMGFQLDSEARRYLGPTSFGHDGAGGQVAFADSDSRLGFAFITNRMEAIDDHRATRIVDALREALQ